MSEYLLQDDLIDYANVPGYDPDSWGRPDTDRDVNWNREGWITASLPERASVESHRSGGYQGTWVAVVELDGILWLIDSYYGSCGGCDAFVDNKKSETENLLRSARGFASVDDLKSWLVEDGDDNLCFRGSFDTISNSTVMEMVDEVTSDG